MSEILKLFQSDDSLALFGSIDDRPFFQLVGICPESLLFETVYRAMFNSDDVDEQHRDEVNGVVDELLERGHFRFEDGWLSLRRGMADAIAFVTEKVKEQIAETGYAEDKWEEQRKRADENEARYRALRDVLRMALTDKVDVVVGEATKP